MDTINGLNVRSIQTQTMVQKTNNLNTHSAQLLDVIVVNMSFCLHHPDLQLSEFITVVTVSLQQPPPPLLTTYWWASLKWKTCLFYWAFFWYNPTLQITNVFIDFAVFTIQAPLSFDPQARWQHTETWGRATKRGTHTRAILLGSFLETGLLAAYVNWDTITWMTENVHRHTPAIET